jgi:hypothetical protein
MDKHISLEDQIGVLRDICADHGESMQPRPSAFLLEAIKTLEQLVDMRTKMQNIKPGDEKATDSVSLALIRVLKL